MEGPHSEEYKLRTRPRPWLAPGAIAAALALAGLGVVPAVADGGERVVLDRGHVDVAATVTDGTFSIRVKDDTVSPSEFRELDDVVFHVTPEAAVDIPDTPAYDFTGAPGERAYVLPQQQAADLLWPGWSTEHLPAGYLAPDEYMTFELTGVTGPEGSDFSLFQTGAFGSPQPLLSTVTGAGSLEVRPQYAHAHGSWVFTDPGYYFLDVRYALESTDGPVEARETLVVAVDSDPTAIPGEGPGPTPGPDPTGEPEPTPGPTGGPEPTPDPTGDPEPTPGPTGDPDPAPDPTGEPEPSEPPADPVVLSEGHVDLRPVIEDDLTVYAGYDDPSAGEKVYYDADEVVFHARPESRGSVPEGEAFSFLGEPGGDLWMLPQVQRADLLWPGWSTEDIGTDQIDGTAGVDWTLTGYDGPGTFSLFQNDAFGSPRVVFHTGDGVPDTLAGIPAGVHAHGNWAFTAEGHYWLDLSFSATTPQGRELEGETTLVVAVGDVDPGEVPDRDGTGTPDPTADPTDPSGPEPRPTDGSGGVPPAGGGSTKPDLLAKTGALLVPLVIGGVLATLIGSGLLMVRRRTATPIEEN